VSNAIPLLEGTNASGGFLVPDGDGGIVFSRGLNRESAIASMPGLRIRQVPGKREKLTEYVGRPTVATVAEGAPKPATGAEYAQVTLDIVKAATTIMYTEELIEDAVEDPTILINNDVRAAFADWVDSNALGRNAAGTIVGSFNSELSETSQTVELGTSGDALAVAISSAMALIEANGYTPTGAILANDGRAHLRNARGPGDNAANPLYTPGFSASLPPELYVPIRFTTNLQTFAGAAGAGRVVGVVGDFSQAVLGIRKDISIAFSDQATIDVGGTLHHLWQQNKVASRWEMRGGFVAHDLNRAFVAIINAS
jgi:HK97 family phage major capsid protein